MPDSFTFILNHINSDITEPVEIIDNHKFHRANSKQTQKIKEVIESFFPNNRFGSANELIFKGNGEFNKQKLLHLDESKWRYWVISFKGKNSKIDDINLAASLLKNDLEFGFTLIGDIPEIDNPNDEYFGYTFNYQKLSSFIDSKAIYKHGSPEITKISREEVREIGIIYRSLINRKKEVIFLDIALQRWQNIKTLPRDSDLMIIGLLSIIECLITHKPTSSNDSSINHQIKTKIPLLSRRFKRPLEYDCFSQEVNTDTIWKNIYNYRSDIVHGSKKIENVPKILSDKIQVINFLKEVTKLLILVSLSETELVADLKYC